MAAIDIEPLRTFLKALGKTGGLAAQESFAKRAGTTVGYLRKAMSNKELIAESTVIGLDRESGGEVPMESLRPDVDWSYVRDPSRSRSTTRRKSA